MLQRTLFFWVCFIFLVNMTCPAQQPTPDKAKPNEEKAAAKAAARAEREKKAWEILEELVTEAQSFKLPENRTHLQLAAADLLWEKDEARARSLYQSAASSVAEMMNELETDDPNFYSRFQHPQQLRHQIINQVARRDTQFALSLLRSTRPAKYPERSQHDTDPDAQIELQLASAAARTDPKRALQIAEENLQKGVTGEVLQLIHQLQEKDRPLAQRLIGMVMEKLKSEDFLKNYQSLQVASSLLSLAQNTPQSNDPKQQSLLSEQDKKELVGLLVAAALSPKPKTQGVDMRRQAIYSLAQHQSLVEKYAPQQAQALKQQTAAIAPNFNPHEKVFQEFNQHQPTASVTQLLEFTKNADPEIRGHLYSQIAHKAAQQGDVERAREIINTYLPSDQRRGMLDNLDTQEMFRLANENKIEEARRLMARFPSKERKAGILMQLIDITKAKADAKTRMQLLDEVRALLGTRIETQSQFYTQMHLIGRYVQDSPAQSWELMEPFISQLNTIIAASEVLDSIEERQGFQHGELRMQSQGTVAANMLIQFLEPLSASAKIDFDRALALADRFDRREIRVMIRLALIRNILSEKETNEQEVESVSRIRPIRR